MGKCPSNPSEPTKPNIFFGIPSALLTDYPTGKRLDSFGITPDGQTYALVIKLPENPAALHHLNSIVRKEALNAIKDGCTVLKRTGVIKMGDPIRVKYEVEVINL